MADAENHTQSIILSDRADTPDAANIDATYCDCVPFGVDLGHIESNDGAALCDPGCDAGA